jgi:predicted ribonuclease toxin of YeeF-YezG toxin-antitoxin module
MARTTVKSNDLRSPLYATLGATDRAVELVRESVTDLQTRLTELQQSIDKLDRDPQQLRTRTVGAVNEQAENLTREAQRRRAAIEARINELQTRALEVPEKVQGFLEQHEVAYNQLVARGDALVSRIRRQKSTQDAKKSAKTTTSKAKTTGTQASKAGKSTASSAQRAAKNTASTAKSKSQAPKSSAKATATSAGKTAKSGAKATSDAAKKVGS